MSDLFCNVNIEYELTQLGRVNPGEIIVLEGRDLYLTINKAASELSFLVKNLSTGESALLSIDTVVGKPRALKAI